MFIQGDQQGKTINPHIDPQKCCNSKWIQDDEHEKTSSRLIKDVEKEIF